MIKSIYIQNFQSHAETKLELVPGVNIIVGPSDSGKTAIVRATRWVVWNRPSGDYIRSHWGGQTTVELETESGIVSRIKDKNDLYLIDYKGGRKLEFKAFRTDVPQEVLDFLNINEINLQRQLDSPFLLSSSSGEVAQHFNKVAKLDKIDLSTQRINSEIRDLNSDIKRAGVQKEQLERELTKFSYLEKAEIELEVLEGLNARFENELKRVSKLQSLITNIRDKQTQIDQESGLLKFEDSVNSLLDLYEQKQIKFTRSLDLQADIDDIVDISAKMDAYNLILQFEKQVNSLLNLSEQLEERNKRYKGLLKLKDGIINFNEQLTKAKDKQTILQERFEKEFPDVCPLCNKPK